MSEHYQAMRDCPACDGEGHYPLDHDHPTAELSPVAMYETPPCDEPDCEYGTCGVYGIPCEPCEGIGTTSEGVDCEACEGEGVIPCAACDGKGTRTDYCGQCHEEIEGRGYFDVSCYLGDGELYCTGCAAEMYECKACNGEERVPLEPVDDPQDSARKVPAVPGSCSCCGADPREKGRGVWNPWGEGPARDYDWYCFAARVVDVDGIYFARLCGDEEGRGGCLDDADRASDGEHDGAKLVVELLDGDDDGAAAMIEDYRAVGLLD